MKTSSICLTLFLIIFHPLVTFAQTVIPNVDIDYEDFPHKKPKDKQKKDGKKSFTLTIFPEDYISPLRQGYELSPTLKCYPDYKEINSLAVKLGLDKKPELNSNFIIDEGDNSYWALQGIHIDQLIRRFSLRKAALDALEREKVILKNENGENSMGLWDSVADSILLKTNFNGEWKKLRRNDGGNCKASERIISFLIDDSMMIVNMDRINKMKDKIKNSPYPSGSLSLGKAKDLAENHFEINHRLGCNDYLSFLDGDYSNLLERFNNDAEELNKYFAGIKIVFESAKNDNSGCFDLSHKGKLSYAVEEFILKRYF